MGAIIMRIVGIYHLLLDRHVNRRDYSSERRRFAPDDDRGSTGSRGPTSP